MNEIDCVNIYMLIVRVLHEIGEIRVSVEVENE